MSDQLFRIDEDTDSSRRRTRVVSWRLDDQTRRIGRDGIAAARAVLRDSRSRYDHEAQRAA